MCFHRIPLGTLKTNSVFLYTLLLLSFGNILWSSLQFGLREIVISKVVYTKHLDTIQKVCVGTVDWHISLVKLSIHCLTDSLNLHSTLHGR